MDLSKIIPPEWYPLVAAAATLALTVIARKGYNVPIISALLTFLIGRPPAVPTPGPVEPGPVMPSPTPVTPSGHPLLDAILAAILAKLGGSKPVGFWVEDGTDPETVVLTLQKK